MRVGEGAGAAVLPVRGEGSVAPSRLPVVRGAAEPQMHALWGLPSIWLTPPPPLGGSLRKERGGGEGLPWVGLKSRPPRPTRDGLGPSLSEALACPPPCPVPGPLGWCSAGRQGDWRGGPGKTGAPATAHLSEHLNFPSLYDRPIQLLPGSVSI